MKAKVPIEGALVLCLPFFCPLGVSHTPSGQRKTAFCTIPLHTTIPMAQNRIKQILRFCAKNYILFASI